MRMHVLVTGANGFVGSELVPVLVDAGHSVTALVRDIESYQPPPDVTVLEGDLTAPAALQQQVVGIDVAYYLVHSLGTGPRFAAQDRYLARQFRELATAGDFSRVIYLGGLGETGPELSPHLRSRREVETILRMGSYDLTVLRAAIIIGAGSTSFQMIKQLASRLPIMLTPRWVRTPCQPIAIRDVIRYLVGVLAVPGTAGQTFDIGGPDIVTYESMLRRTARQLDRHVLIIPLPILSPRLSVYWVDLVTDVPAAIAHPLIYGLKNPVVVRDTHIQDYVQLELTPFDTAVETALAAG